MGASTDQISQELTERRAAAEREASTLRARAGQAARRARPILPAAAALAGGSVAGVAVVFVVDRRRRGRNPVATQLRELTGWLRVAAQRMASPMIRVEVGSHPQPSPERQGQRRQELLIQIAQVGGSAAASAAGAALTSRLLGRDRHDSK